MYALLSTQLFEPVLDKRNLSGSRLSLLAKSWKVLASLLVIWHFLLVPIEYLDALVILLLRLDALLVLWMMAGQWLCLLEYEEFRRRNEFIFDITHGISLPLEQLIMLEWVLYAGAHRLVNIWCAAIQAHMIEVTVNHYLTIEVHIVFAAILFLAGLWE